MKRSALAIVALIAAATADITGRLAVIGPVRLTVYQALVAVVAVLTVVAIRTGRIALSRSRLDLPAAAFVATLALSLVMAHDIGLALTAFASMLSSLVLAYLVLYLVDRPEKVPAIVWGVLAVSAIFGVAALLEYFKLFALQPAIVLVGSGVRSRVTFKDPNILGSFLAPAALLGISAVPTLPAARSRLLAIAGITLTLAGIACTQSRGAFLGVAVGAAVLLLLARVPFKRKMLAVAGAVVVGAVLTAALAGNPVFRQRVLDIGSDESAMTRVWMAQSALRAWVDHPMGVGIGDFKVVYPDYADPRVRVSLTESHTMYTTLLVEIGFLGFAAAAFLALRWFGAARSALSADDPRVSALARGTLAAGFALGAQAFTYSLEPSKYLWLVIGLGFAAERLGAGGRHERTDGSERTT
ncbi:MAG: O-antigen ligase family protein [Coriobacteriia bacterium]|nr:O-antigen ligase family protein [Coriobacteriia bacterium]